MTQAKEKFGEQAVNRFIELVLSRLVDADRLRVRVKADLKKLGRGELDGLTMQMFGFLLRQHLRVTEFQFEIGPSAVNMRSIMKRKIELLHPSEGSVQVAISQTQLTSLLQSELTALPDPSQDCQLQQVECLIAEPTIVCHFTWQQQGISCTGTWSATPQIAASGNQVCLDSPAQADDVPEIWLHTTIARLSEILNLTDIANQGTTFAIQSLVFAPETLMIQASAYIEQVPSN